MIELMIGLAILAFLMMAGAPSFSAWIKNTQTRTAAEAIQDGLQLAKSEAVRRNAPVKFSLVTTADNNCELSTSIGNWVVSLDDPVSGCGSTPASGAADPAPRIIQVRSNAEGSSKVVISADKSSVVFNGLGRATPPATICIGMKNVDVESCATAATSDERHLQVSVSAGGQIRMCNPAKSHTDPQGC